MRILYYASMLAGELDSSELALNEDGDTTKIDKSGPCKMTSQIPQVLESHICTRIKQMQQSNNELYLFRIH